MTLNSGISLTDILQLKHLINLTPCWYTDVGQSTTNEGADLLLITVHVKVRNTPTYTTPAAAESPNAQDSLQFSSGTSNPKTVTPIMMNEAVGIVTY